MNIRESIRYSHEESLGPGHSKRLSQLPFPFRRNQIKSEFEGAVFEIMPFWRLFT